MVKTSHSGVWVRSLVGELRSHMPCSQPKRKKQGVGPLDRADSLFLTTQEILLIIDCFKCYFKNVDEH